MTGGDIWVCEGYFAIITTPLLLSSCNWYTPNQVLYETGQGLLYFGFDNKIVSLYDFAQPISFLLHWLPVCIKYTSQHFSSTKVRILVPQCLLPLIKTVSCSAHAELSCKTKACKGLRGKRVTGISVISRMAGRSGCGNYSFHFLKESYLPPILFLTMRF